LDEHLGMFIYMKCKVVNVCICSKTILSTFGSTLAYTYRRPQGC